NNDAQLGGSGGSGAGMGGAVFNDGGTVTITNSTFYDNHAVGGANHGNGTAGKGLGGALVDLNGKITITNSTISGNTATDGARGMLVLGYGGTAKGYINNTIIYHSDYTNVDLVVSGTATVSGTTNLIHSTELLNGGTTNLTSPLFRSPGLAAGL